MAVWQFNRGEWTEAYVFMRLLGDGRIYGASSELTKDDSTYIDIINIIRDEPDKILIFERFIEDNIAYVRASKEGESIKVVTAPELSYCITMQSEQEGVCEMKEVKGLLFFNMKNSLSAADSFFLYGERYDEFCTARETINKVYRFEELFAIVLAAALDYDMLEANLLDRARYMINMEHALYQNGIEMNHRLLGFLSSLCTYCEAVRDAFGDECRDAVV